MKTALICGVSGQDGGYLAQLLLGRGYKVVGTSRDAAMASFGNLKRLGIAERITTASCALTDFRSILQVLMNHTPDEIYNLAGQSSVGLSFEQPAETLESIGVGTLNLLEAVRMLRAPTRLYSACSSECFGDTSGEPAHEETPFRPRSPYGVAKATSFWQVRNYREAYGIHACSGLLFNHESPLRPPRFVTRKVVASAARIAAGSGERLRLGDVSIRRDWGWAPEYVDAMWRMLQTEVPEDFVICTGESNPLASFVEEAFALVGLDWNAHVDIDRSFFRPTDIACTVGDPSLARTRLGWSATRRMRDVVREMMTAERAINP